MPPRKRTPAAPRKRATPLRSVGPDEKPPAKKAVAKKPVTIKAAVDLPERDLLVAMRQKVAAEIDGGVPAHTLAPLMRQLRELDKEIRSLDARESEEGDRRDRGTDEDEAFDASAI